MYFSNPGSELSKIYLIKSYKQFCKKNHEISRKKSRLIQISTRKEGSLVRLTHIDLVNGMYTLL